MASAAQRPIVLPASASETARGGAKLEAAEVPLQASASESHTADYASKYEGYRSLVDRAVEVFGDNLTASRWLSMPSEDLAGRVPLQVAQGLQYDEQKMRTVFEPVFLQIEHGIYA